MMMSVASAATVTCNGSVSNTGPNSNNTVTCVSTNNVTVSCVNNVVVANTNNQTSTSGSASTSGNTTGGSSTSGSSSNSNSATVNVGASCAPVASAPNTFTTAAAAGGQGGGSASTAGGAGAAKVGSLPKTGSNTAEEVGVIGAIVLGAGLAASQFGVRAYRRLALK